MVDNTVKTLTPYHGVKSGGENFATHQLMYIFANEGVGEDPPYRFCCTISFIKYILAQGHS